MNQAFANHWDKMNPTAQKQACDHSRQLMEDEQRRQKQCELEKISWQKQCELYKLSMQKQTLK
jgi:hypothetical protein